MKNILFLSILLSSMLVFHACSSDSDSLSGTNPKPNPGPNPAPDTWLVPSNEVFDGGPGKDGIPSVDQPNFSKATEIDFLSNQDIVLGFVSSNGDLWAYPHPIMDWHEIVNHNPAGLNLAITYCPLTGTGVAWNREIDGEVTTFGVSGLLYNTNLMPYDRKTNSTWSQQRLDCVNGELIGQKAETYTLVETSWATWKNAYPDSEVMNTNTGFNRSYGLYPYNDYRENQSRLLFPISEDDGRLPRKERTLGIILESGQKVYTFNDGTDVIDMVDDQVGNQDLIIVRSKIKNFIVAFAKPADRSFELITDDFPWILRDQNGQKYDLMGTSSNGSEADRLALPTQFMGFWFSWGTFYPNIELYGA